jgi:hypothetical protein
MSSKQWVGNAAAVLDVWVISLSGTVTSQTYSVTINSKSITYVAGSGDTVATILAGLVTAWQNLQIPPPVEFSELTPVVSGTTIVATANAAGNPCVISVSTGGSATFTIAHTQSATGPNDFANAQNWVGGVAPANGDTLIFDNGSTSCLFGLSTSLTGITVNVNPGFSGNIGLPIINSNNSTPYAEYRTRALTLTGGTAVINSGSLSRCNLAFGSTAATVRAQQTGRRIDANTPVVLITGGASGSQLDVSKGDVGVAFYQTDTANFPTILTTYISNALTDVTLYCGPGATLGTITANGGNMTINSNVTTLTMGTGGGILLINAGAVTTLTADNGTILYNSTGTLGTCILAGNATLSFDQDPRAKTLTNPIEVYGNSAIVADNNKVVNSGTLSVTTYLTTAINVQHGAGSAMTFT